MYIYVLISGNNKLLKASERTTLYMLHFNNHIHGSKTEAFIKDVGLATSNHYLLIIILMNSINYFNVINEMLRSEQLCTCLAVQGW